MTNAEQAELRGEIFGLKILLFNSITEAAARYADPLIYLDQLQRQSVEGIVKATPAQIKPGQLSAFQNAAAGIIGQAVEAAKAVLIPTPPRDQLQ